MSSLLELSDLSVARGGRRVLGPVTLTIGAGEVVGLIGPNGAGKTTLMRAALGLLSHQGRSSLAALAPAARARQVAFLPQGRQIAWPVAVEELVALGRAPHGRADPSHPAVIRAIARMGLEALRQRPATGLSGGEQARALIARALAQETPLLLADEPVAGLDPEGQIDALTLFADLAREEGRSTLVSIHDLGLAARHCTRLVLLDRGRLIADGPPAEILSPALIGWVFGIRAYRAETEEGLIFQPIDKVDPALRSGRDHSVAEGSSSSS